MRDALLAEAKAELFALLDEVPARYTTLSVALADGHLDPTLFWSPDRQCGCVYGHLLQQHGYARWDWLTHARERYWRAHEDQMKRWFGRWWTVDALYQTATPLESLAYDRTTLQTYLEEWLVARAEAGTAAELVTA
jgi:hypothetical protein